MGEAPGELTDGVTDSGVFQIVLDGYDAVYDALAHSTVFIEIWRTYACGADFPDQFAHIGFLTVDEGRRLLQLLRLGADGLLVDVACGAGGPGLWAAQQTGAALIGVDPSAAGFAAARRRGERTLHPRYNTFPGELLLDLAADAIGVSGASRQSPLELEAIRERHLPDGIAHTKAQHHKSKFALRAAAMMHGGVDPGLLDEVQWWRTDDLWYWSLEALAAYVRAAADRTGQPVRSVCVRIAQDCGIALAGVDSASPPTP